MATRKQTSHVWEFFEEAVAISDSWKYDLIYALDNAH